MTIPRGLFLLLVGMLLGGLLAVCITFAALPPHHPGWGLGIIFTALTIISVWFWVWDTE